MGLPLKLATQLFKSSDDKKKIFLCIISDALINYVYWHKDNINFIAITTVDHVMHASLSLHCFFSVKRLHQKTACTR